MPSNLISLMWPHCVVNWVLVQVSALQKREAGIFQQYTATTSLVSPHTLQLELGRRKKRLAQDKNLRFMEIKLSMAKGSYCLT